MNRQWPWKKTQIEKKNPRSLCRQTSSFCCYNIRLQMFPLYSQCHSKNQSIELMQISLESISKLHDTFEINQWNRHDKYHRWLYQNCITESKSTNETDMELRFIHRSFIPLMPGLQIKGHTHTQPFKCQPHKMVKHTQTIRRQFPDNLFECVWPFCVVGA